MAGILHRCAQLPAAAGGGLVGAAALTKPQSRVRPMTLLFFRCRVLTRSLTRRRQDPGLDSAIAAIEDEQDGPNFFWEGRQRADKSSDIAIPNTEHMAYRLDSSLKKYNVSLCACSASSYSSFASSSLT